MLAGKLANGEATLGHSVGMPPARHNYTSLYEGPPCSTLSPHFQESSSRGSGES